jgi:hypothetical protein
MPLRAPVASRHDLLEQTAVDLFDLVVAYVCVDAVSAPIRDHW